MNLVELLKDFPVGTELYSTVFGKVSIFAIIPSESYPIHTIDANGKIRTFDSEGRYEKCGECVLFFSKGNRDWSTIEVKKPGFAPETLKPFDKVLVRNSSKHKWQVAFFSHIDKSLLFPFYTTDGNYSYCIPYNEETTHLVGATQEAPEYYRRENALIIHIS